MSQDFQSKSLSDDEIQRLLDSAQQRGDKRRQQGLSGFDAESVNIIQGLRPVLGGALNRGATGQNPQNIKQKRPFQIILTLDASGSTYHVVGAMQQGLEAMRVDLCDSANPMRFATEITVIIYEGEDGVRYLKLPDDQGNEIEIVNCPILSMPRVTANAWQAGGSTPQNKAILLATIGGSLRQEELLQGGIGGQYRRVSHGFLVNMGDGENNIWSEFAPNGQRVNYDNDAVKKMTSVLHGLETWDSLFVYAGTDSTARIEADKLGFRYDREISNTVEDWLETFRIVSQASKTASQAAGSPSQSINGFLGK